LHLLLPLPLLPPLLLVGRAVLKLVVVVPVPLLLLLLVAPTRP
jgi:hypothetical protein